MTGIIHIGNLKVHQSQPLGSGQFGNTFQGVYQRKTKVVVSLVDKKEFHVDVDVLTKDVVNHPNILRILCIEKNQQFQFIASELNSGTLQDLVLDYNGLADHNLKKILFQITTGVEYLHQKKIFHCELKPSNVFFSQSDRSVSPIMKLGNFGVYRRGRGYKCVFELSLSKSYMPSETHEKLTFTAAMDLFALGCLYGFTLSRGRHPFGDDEEIRISRIQKREPMTLTVQHLKNVEDAARVFELICSLLSVNPSKRPSAKAVLKHSFFDNLNESDNHSTSQEKNFIELNRAPAKASHPLSSSYQESRKRKNNDCSKENSKRNMSERESGKDGKKIKQEKEMTMERKTLVHSFDNNRGEAVGWAEIHRTSTRQKCWSDDQDYKEIQQFDGIFFSLEAELLKLCSQERLDAAQLFRFRQLVADPSVSANCKTGFGETPLVLLCSRNQSDSLLPALQALLMRDDVDLEATYSSYNSLNLLLRFYRQENLIRCTSLLIKRGIRVNETDGDGQKPILIVCRFYAGEDLIDICRVLFGRNMVDTATVLKASFILTDRGLHEESMILEKMTQYGELELTGKEKELHALCSKRNADTLTSDRIEDLALDKHVDVNRTGIDFRSPIQQLFRHNQGNSVCRCLRALLKRKSLDVDVSDQTGNDLLVIACFHRSDATCLLEIVTLLIGHGINVNKTNSERWNALLALCCRPPKRGYVSDMLEIVRALINAGTDVNATCEDGSNCLIALATNHYNRPDFFAILRLLIQNGADVNAVSFKQQNVLPVLCYKYKRDDFVDIVRLLLNYGIDTNRRDGRGLKAVDILIKKRRFSKDSEIVRLIQDSYKINC